MLLGFLFVNCVSRFFSRERAWSDLLHDSGRASRSNTPSRDILGDNRPGPDRASLPDRDAREDGHIGADPAIVPDGDGLRKLNVGSATLDLNLVRRRANCDVWAEHDTVSDGDQGAVQDVEIEVGVEALANTDVAAVVDLELGLNEDLVVGDEAEEVLESCRARFLQAREALLGLGGECGVVVVACEPGLEASLFKLWDEGVVSESERG